MSQHVCPHCLHAFESAAPFEHVYCPQCGKPVYATAQEAPKAETPPPYQQAQRAYQEPRRPDSIFDDGPSGKSRGVCGLLAILLGTLGVHYFYLNKIGAGIICIVLSLVTCGFWGVITLIQGILMLTMSQEDFERKYANSPSSFPIF